MYNGIGLQTARGSGTNGYVQRNTAFIPKGRDDVKFKTEEDIKRLEASANREPNQGILDHERKRKLEVKCMELEEVLEEQGYTEAEIEEKVSAYRKMLLSKEVSKKAFAEVDEFGRPVLKETHQIAEAQKEKNRALKEAFGISSSFIEGSSFDPNRREMEAAVREEERKKRDEERDQQRAARREREEKQNKKKESSSDSSSSSSDSEDEKDKHRKKKSSRKSRSGSKERRRNDRRRSDDRRHKSRDDDRRSDRRQRRDSRHEDVEIKEERESSIRGSINWETNKRHQIEVKDEPPSPPPRSRDVQDRSQRRRDDRSRSVERSHRREERRDESDRRRPRYESPDVEIKQEKDHDDDRRRHGSSADGRNGDHRRRQESPDEDRSHERRISSTVHVK